MAEDTKLPPEICTLLLLTPTHLSVYHVETPYPFIRPPYMSMHPTNYRPETKFWTR